MGVNALPAAGALAGMGFGELAGLPAAPLTLGTSLAAGPMMGAMIGNKVGEWARYGLAPSVGLPQEVPGVTSPSDALNSLLAGIGLGGAGATRGAALMIYKDA